MWVWIPKFPLLTRSHLSAASEAFSPELLDTPCGVTVCGALWAPRRFVGHDKLAALGLWSPFGDRKLQADLCCTFPALQLQSSMKIQDGGWGGSKNRMKSAFCVNRLMCGTKCRSRF